MTSIRTLGLAAVLSAGLAGTGLAVTGNDSTGKPNGTAGMTQAPPAEAGKTGSYANGKRRQPGPERVSGPAR
jgi:hypothetical protein